MTAPVSPVSDDQPLSADAASLPASALPDRADAPVSEVSERFLRAVMAEIPLDRLEELHLFSPLRQGTVETGIAVLAVRVPVIVTEPEAAATPADPELALDDPSAEPVIDTTAAPSAAEAGHEAVRGGEAETVSDAVAVMDHVPLESLVDEASDDEDVSYAEELVAEASDDEQGEAEATEFVPPAPAARPVRHTVYTARYRYVIKGPERGKWESNVKAEADAPLITVETVVRGVQRRAGEESEIIRYTAAQVAKILRVPYPAVSQAE